MNTLNLIRKQINRAEMRRRAKLSNVAYRGHVYEMGTHKPVETHGTFQYRGKTYIK